MDKVWSLKKMCHGPGKRETIEVCALVLNYIIVAPLKPSDVNCRVYTPVLFAQLAAEQPSNKIFVLTNRDCVGVCFYFPALSHVINLSYTLSDSCPSPSSSSVSPTATISSASLSPHWSLTLCHHKTMQLCEEGTLERGRAAQCVHCDLRRGYSLFIQEASGSWNERLCYPKTMKHKANEGKNVWKRGVHKRLRAHRSVRHF